jgi:hypothetical protein
MPEKKVKTYANGKVHWIILIVMIVITIIAIILTAATIPDKPDQIPAYDPTPQVEREPWNVSATIANGEGWVRYSNIKVIETCDSSPCKEMAYTVTLTETTAAPTKLHGFQFSGGVAITGVTPTQVLNPISGPAVTPSLTFSGTLAEVNAGLNNFEVRAVCPFIADAMKFNYKIDVAPKAGATGSDPKVVVSTQTGSGNVITASVTLID